MAFSSILKVSLTISTLFLNFFVCSCKGFYNPGSSMNIYSAGEEIYAIVNSLTSTDTQLPFSYYSLPHCKPKCGIKRRAQNLGELLMGHEIVNSPYRFRMNITESLYLCTSNPLTKEETNLLKQRTRDLYQVNMILDNLPVARYAKFKGETYQWTGIPVGYRPVGSNEDYIVNHLKFRVLIHEYEDSPVRIIGKGEEGIGVITESDIPGYQIVGFEVVPCSVKHHPEVMSKLNMYDRISPVNCPFETDMLQVIQEQARVTFTYEVEFQKSDIQWTSRWDAYLKMEGAQFHWFSSLNSLVTIFLLTGFVLFIFSRIIRESTEYEILDKESQVQMNEELLGWKLIVSDVFREPNCSKLLCVMVGDGVQIAGTAFVTIVLSVLGFLSPASPGMLLTWTIVLYLLLGMIGGYVGIRLWRTIKGTSEGWRSVSWSIACFFPGIAFIILIVLNFILQHCRTTATLSISSCFKLTSLWFCIQVPLTLLGGFLGTLAEGIKFPVQTNHIPREIPERKNLPWLFVVGVGTLPFRTLFIELFFIFSSIWLGTFYYAFGFLLLVLFLFVIVCAEVSVILTYKHLQAEDWRWWWKAFFASGSVGLYVFLYSINYLVSDLRYLNGPVSAILYLGYSLIMAFAIMLAAGTIGFLVSFNFVYHLFSAFINKKS